MAKQTKKPVSKVVVGNTKSKKGLSLTKRTALFGLVGIMAFSIIAGFGMQKWQDHQLTAKAANWTVLQSGTSQYPYKFIACKTAVTSNYGPLWKISLILENNGINFNINGNLYNERAQSLISTAYLFSKPGQWTYATAYASRILDDTYSAQIHVSTTTGGFSTSGPFVQSLSYSTITNC